MTEVSGQTIGPIFRVQDFPETSVRNYQYLLRNNPEERNSDLFRSGNLKSRIQ